MTKFYFFKKVDVFLKTAFKIFLNKKFKELLNPE
jgi:hypothetical protein